MTRNYTTIAALAITLLYVDLFCGAGGTSTGVEQATVNGLKCAKVIACVNHDKNAIVSHAENHPETKHFTEDIKTLDVSANSELVRHVENMKKKYPFARLVLWASLECTNHSNAKGGMSRDADSRTLAEHLDRYYYALNPDLIQIENVKEFLDWGPLRRKVVRKDGTCYSPLNIKKDKKTKEISIGPVWMPEPKKKGIFYKRWKKDTEKLGYAYQHTILNSADYGAYQARRRLFIQFAKPGIPIVWPEPTHHKLGEYGLEKWKACREVLDLGRKGKSIFEGKPKVEATLERLYAGLVKFVANGDDSWIVKYNSMSGNGHHNPPGINEPCHTVACQNRLGLANVQFISKYFSGNPASKNISVDAPTGAVTTIDHHSLVATEFISAYYGNGHNVSSVESPAPTLTTKDRLAKVDVSFIDQQYGKSKPASIDSPIGALTTNPKFAKVDVSSFLLNPQYQSKGGSVDGPCFTLIARMDKMPPYIIQLETGELAIEIYDTDSPMTVKIKQFMAAHGIIDIKMRMLYDYELKQIQGFPLDYVLVGTQEEVKKYIGNAVEVNTARALIEATAKPLLEKQKAA